MTVETQVEVLDGPYASRKWYDFEEPVTETQLYDILHKAADATQSDFRLNTGRTYQYRSKNQQHNKSASGAEGKLSNDHFTIDFHIHWNADAEIEDEKLNFTGIIFDKVDMKEKNDGLRFANYIDSFIKELKSAYKRIRE